MTEFKSLAAALEGYYEMALADLRGDLRRRVEAAFVHIAWDALAPNNRRRLALEWDAKNDPEREQERQDGWDSEVRLADADRKIDRLKRQIANVGEMVVTAPTEASAKRVELDLLREQLDYAELARKELVDVDGEPEVQPAEAALKGFPLEEASARLGPALFGEEWLPKLSAKDGWLIEEAKRRPNHVRTEGPVHNPLGLARWELSDPISRDQLYAAKQRQQFMNHQHQTVRNWLQERAIETEAQFERAFNVEFPTKRTAEDLPMGDGIGRRPTYASRPTYSDDAVPVEFTQWAEEQHRAGNIITAPMAEDAMRGPKDGKGARSGGLLKQGRGLGRDTIRQWVRTLDPTWTAEHGVPPSRSSKT